MKIKRTKYRFIAALLKSLILLEFELTSAVNKQFNNNGIKTYIIKKEN